MSSPSEEELVSDYLYNKVHGNPLPKTINVKECDLYGEEPCQVWDKNGGPELERNRNNKKRVLYFFTKLKKQSSHGKRFLRRVGSNGGAWQGEDAPKEIKTQFCVGSRKRYRYENPGSDQHGRWIMLEYSLADYNGEPNDFVLCSVKKNNNTTRGRKKRVCDKIESKQEPPLNYQRGEKQIHLGDPIITPDIPPSTPQLSRSAILKEYSNDMATKLFPEYWLENHAPLTCTDHSSSWSVPIQHSPLSKSTVNNENNWTIKRIEELLLGQSTLQECGEFQLSFNENCISLMGWEDYLKGWNDCLFIREYD